MGFRSLRLLSLLLFAGCVPSEPDRTDALGAIFLNVQGTPAAKGSPIVTGDGWTITLSRALIMARAETRHEKAYYGFGGDNAALIDLAYGYAIGVRGLKAGNYGVRGALDPYTSSEYETSQGVGPDDRQAFRPTGGSPNNVHVIGQAVGRQESANAALIIRFDWLFSTYVVDDSATRAQPVTVVPKTRADALNQYDPTFLFRTSMTEDRGLVFAPIAEADIDGDRIVTLDELKRTTPNRGVYSPELSDPSRTDPLATDPVGTGGGGTGGGGTGTEGTPRTSMLNVLNQLAAHAWR